MSDGMIYKNGIPYSEFGGNDITTVDLAMKTVRDGDGDAISEKYMKRADMTTGLIDSAAYHNSMARGIDLTDRLLSGDLYKEIAAGTFRNMFIGDYFILKSKYDSTNGFIYKIPEPGVTYDGYNDEICRIAMFDGFYFSGNNIILANSVSRFIKKHHVVIVTDQLKKDRSVLNITIGNVDFDKSGVVTRCFSNDGDKAYNCIVPLEKVFDSHLLNFCCADYLYPTDGLETIVSGSGIGSSGTTGDKFRYNSRKLDLLTETEIYGSRIWGSGPADNYTFLGQLPLFRYRSDTIKASRLGYYIKGMADINTFMYVDTSGYVSRALTAVLMGVRVKFVLG